MLRRSKRCSAVRRGASSVGHQHPPLRLRFLLEIRNGHTPTLGEAVPGATSRAARLVRGHTLAARGAAFAAGLPSLFAIPLVRGMLDVGGSPTFAGDFSLLLRIH
jgi:hypothetical protein